MIVMVTSVGCLKAMMVAQGKIVDWVFILRWLVSFLAFKFGDESCGTATLRVHDALNTDAIGTDCLESA